MSATARSFLLTLLAAALWVGWLAEHEETSIRAPWTGLTLVASAVAFVAAGVVGRGWRALVAPVVAVPAALVVADLLVFSDVEVDESFVSSCDPGCIPTSVFVLTLTIVAVLLIALGIVVRRGFRMFHSDRRAS